MKGLVDRGIARRRSIAVEQLADSIRLPVLPPRSAADGMKPMRACRMRVVCSSRCMCICEYHPPLGMTCAKRWPEAQTAKRKKRLTASRMWVHRKSDSATL